MGNVRGKFLDALMRHFSLPKSMDGKAQDWMNDYNEALSFYSDAVLEFAAKKLIFAERTSKSFPTPAECLKACKEIHADFAKPAPRPKRHDEWSPEAIKEADRLMKSAIGRKSAEEGWQWALWDFLRRQQRWPNAHEAERLRAHSAQVNAETTEFLASEEAAGRMINPATKRLLGQMSARRKQLKELASSQ